MAISIPKRLRSLLFLRSSRLMEIFAFRSLHRVVLNRARKDARRAWDWGEHFICESHMQITVNWKWRVKCVALVVFLVTPFVSPWLIEAIAANYYDWIYYGNYYSLISLSFLVCAIAIFFLLKKPKKIIGFGLLIGVSYLLIGVFLPSPRCEEYLTFLASKPAKQTAHVCN